MYIMHQTHHIEADNERSVGLHHALSPKLSRMMMMMMMTTTTTTTRLRIVICYIWRVISAILLAYLWQWRRWRSL